MTKIFKPLPHHLSDFLDWLDIEKGLSSKSQENYANFLGRFFQWLKIQDLENLKPHELTQDIAWRYRVFLSRHESLKRSTQNYYLIALRSLLTYFVERDISSLPPEKIKLAHDKGEKEVRFLTRDQLEKFFSGPNVSTFRGLRNRAILEVLFSTGLRIAELVSLNREQIQFPKTVSDELEVVITGKGGRVRPVYFSERALTWLSRYLKERGDVHEALFITYGSAGAGAKKTARRISPRTIQELFKKNAIKSGIPLTTTPHVMRHSFATDLVARGVDIRAVQEFLGHKSITATQIYTHVTSKQLKDIHKKFHGGESIMK